MNPTTTNPDRWANWDYTGSSDDDKFPNEFSQQPITDQTTTKTDGDKKEESTR